MGGRKDIQPVKKPKTCATYPQRFFLEQAEEVNGKELAD